MSASELLSHFAYRPKITSLTTTILLLLFPQFPSSFTFNLLLIHFAFRLIWCHDPCPTCFAIILILLRSSYLSCILCRRPARALFSHFRNLRDVLLIQPPIRTFLRQLNFPNPASHLNLAYDLEYFLESLTRPVLWFSSLCAHLIVSIFRREKRTSTSSAQRKRRTARLGTIFRVNSIQLL